MRFKTNNYKNEVIWLQYDNSIKNRIKKITTEDSIEFFNEETDSDSVIIKDYKKLLDIIRKISLINIDKKIYIRKEETKDIYLITMSTVATSLFRENFVCLYKPENEALHKAFKMLFGITDTLTASTFISTSKNNHNFYYPYAIIRTILTTADLENRNEKLFERRTKLKKNGKVRVYYAPNEDLKDCLREVNLILQNAYEDINSDFQVAYKRGKNILTNADQHKHHQYVFNIDLKDFYPSCKRKFVEKYCLFLFPQGPGATATKDKFMDIILIDDGLFIGNPISGILANTVIHKPVAYMKNICKNRDVEFSVYADDMTFSSNRFISEEFVKGVFNEAFSKYEMEDYFKMNEEKSVGYSGSRRRITGVSINNSDNCTVSRKYYRTLRVGVEKAVHDKEVNLQKLRGQIAFALMLDQSKKVFNYLKKYEDDILRLHLVSQEKWDKLKEE